MNKTLDKIDVTLTPHDALRIIAHFDERGDAWHLLGDGVADDDSLHMTIHVDGTETLMGIKLKADGTWTAISSIVFNVVSVAQ